MRWPPGSGPRQGDTAPTSTPASSTSPPSCRARRKVKRALLRSGPLSRATEISGGETVTLPPPRPARYIEVGACNSVGVEFVAGRPGDTDAHAAAAVELGTDAVDDALGLSAEPTCGRTIELVAADPSHDVVVPVAARGRSRPYGNSSPAAWPSWSLIALKPSSHVDDRAAAADHPAHAQRSDRARLWHPVSSSNVARRRILAHPRALGHVITHSSAPQTVPSGSAVPGRLTVQRRSRPWSDTIASSRSLGPPASTSDIVDRGRSASTTASSCSHSSGTSSARDLAQALVR